MPGGDRTGPRGAGPMTGRGAGMCAGYDVPGYMAPAGGRGYGRGRGRGRGFQGGGRGWRHQYYATGVPGWARGEEYPGHPPAEGRARPGELANLKRQARHFKDALGNIEARIAELRQETGIASQGQQEATD